MAGKPEQANDAEVKDAELSLNSARLLTRRENVCSSLRREKFVTKRSYDVIQGRGDNVLIYL